MDKQQALQNLLAGLIQINLTDEIKVTGLAVDSRLVKPGDLFFAFQGQKIDSRPYIADALAKGAAAVVCEAELDLPAQLQMVAGKPVITIAHFMKTMALIAARFYGDPTQKLKVIGITGTNGKTSCSQWLAQALTKSGLPCGVMGTLGWGLPGKLQSLANTTPGPVTVQALAAELLQKGAQALAMEVSSHALAQQRVSAVHFDIGIFTNLTQDHLDFHKDMATYAEAKRQLFLTPGLQVAILNIDDPVGAQWANTLPPSVAVYTYGLMNNAAMVRATILQQDKNGLKVQFTTPWGEACLQTALLGRFNVSNLCAVLTTLCVMDFSLADALLALTGIASVPGRLECFGGSDKKPLVVVDFAHTPDALAQVLSALRDHSKGKLWCVFGCGGDRDASKRPLMGNIAEQMADVVILTQDNSRSEDPHEIIAQIQAGMQHPAPVEIDRAKAISLAISQAAAEDVVLIAGKGHENYQEIAGQRLPFSDTLLVKAELAKR